MVPDINILFILYSHRMIRILVVLLVVALQLLITGAFLARLGGRRTRLEQLKDMRIQIYGTKNAFTTVRPFDVVLYELEEPAEEDTDGEGEELQKPSKPKKMQRIGLYRADNTIAPLCTYENFSVDFWIDHHSETLNGEELKADGRVLRIISADRRGTEGVQIDEFLDTDTIHIPLRDKESNVLSNNILTNNINIKEINTNTNTKSTNTIVIANANAQSSQSVSVSESSHSHKSQKYKDMNLQQLSSRQRELKAELALVESYIETL